MQHVVLLASGRRRIGDQFFGKFLLHHLFVLLPFGLRTVIVVNRVLEEVVVFVEVRRVRVVSVVVKLIICAFFHNQLLDPRITVAFEGRLATPMLGLNSVKLLRISILKQDLFMVGVLGVTRDNLTKFFASLADNWVDIGKFANDLLGGNVLCLLLFIVVQQLHHCANVWMKRPPEKTSLSPVSAGVVLKHLV